MTREEFITNVTHFPNVEVTIVGFNDDLYVRFIYENRLGGDLMRVNGSRAYYPTEFTEIDNYILPNWISKPREISLCDASTFEYNYVGAFNTIERLLQKIKDMRKELRLKMIKEL